jgi:hypothetical protein
MTVVPPVAPPLPVAADFRSVIEVDETDMPQVGNAVVAYVTSGEMKNSSGVTANPCKKVVVVSASSAVMVHDL